MSCSSVHASDQQHTAINYAYSTSGRTMGSVNSRNKIVVRVVCTYIYSSSAFIALHARHGYERILPPPNRIEFIHRIVQLTVTNDARIVSVPQRTQHVTFVHDTYSVIVEKWMCGRRALVKICPCRVSHIRKQETKNSIGAGVISSYLSWQICLRIWCKMYVRSVKKTHSHAALANTAFDNGIFVSERARSHTCLTCVCVHAL